MKKLFPILILANFASHSIAQVVSCASFLKARQKADVTVPFRYLDEGVETPIEWGLDLSWLDENNIKRGVLYVGKEMIDVIRSPYRPTESVEGGSLSSDQVRYITIRSNIIKRNLKSDVKLVVNDDAPSVDSWYNDKTVSSEERGKRWAKVIDLSLKKYKQLGVGNLETISPFNEPDDRYGAEQGYYDQQNKVDKRMQDFRSIAKSLKEDYAEEYANVRISGGNTLNPDSAYKWWNYCKEYLDEGNTHQLAGTFDKYANFFQAVRNYGHHATADELHNTMEAMVGVEYGMQTGIWWYTCEHSRAQFMKATYHRNPGKRLAYAEHRNNWTAAAVYRQPDGLVQAFGGTSERQAVKTTYNFVSLDRPVWFNGEPGREYVMLLPGGTGYQTGQSNAETVVDIQSTDDPMPHIDGTYKIVNMNSGLLMGHTNSPTSGWTSTTQRSNGTQKTLQWVVTPMPLTCGDDFGYYSIVLNTGNGMNLNLLNNDLSNGANVGIYPGGLAKNEQWYLEYAGQGAFYIRSRYSTKCLEVANGSKYVGGNVQLGDFKGVDYQKWRFLPTNVIPNLIAPEAPTDLVATGQGSSIRLDWTASTSTDVASYTVLRSEDGTSFYAIASGVTTTSFTDNEAADDAYYTYQVYAVDKSLNYSERSNSSRAGVTGERDTVLYYPFNETLNDTTLNGNHCSIYGTPAWTPGKVGTTAIRLSGTDNFIQLPYTIANHDEITVACWVYWRGGYSWQRLWDFGTGINQYMFLSPKSDSGMRFAIKDGGEEQQIRLTKNLSMNKWVHIALTLGDEGAVLYLNGEEAGANANVTIRPSDFRPVLNYIGRSQFASDPYFKGQIDDFRIYNCALSSEEVKQLVDETDGVEAVDNKQSTVDKGQSYDLSGRKISRNTKGIVVRQGRKSLKMQR